MTKKNTNLKELKKITLPNEIFGSDPGSLDSSTDQTTTGDVNSPSSDNYINNRFNKERENLI